MITYSPTMYDYSIDSSDRITNVSDAWVQFARDNESSFLNHDAVISSSIWDYITGMETRQLYHVLFERVRALGITVEIPFRCDSPELRRYMSLKIARSEGESLHLTGILLRAEPRTPVDLLRARLEATDRFIEMCSFCKKIRTTAEDWDEVERAIDRLELFNPESYPRLNHTVCPRCLTDFQRRLSATGLPN